MASLNIRNFPPDLLKALKVEAARRGITLKELVIEGLDYERLNYDKMYAEFQRIQREGK